MTRTSHTKEELNLLLYLESRAVDHGGLLDTALMNDEDWAVLEDWADANPNYVQYGRLSHHDIDRIGRYRAARITHWVRLSPEAVEDAQAERRARMERMWAKRTWTTTEEARGSNA